MGYDLKEEYYDEDEDRRQLGDYGGDYGPQDASRAGR